MMKSTIALLFVLFIFNAQSQEAEAFNASFEFTDQAKTKGGIGQGLIGYDGEYTYTMGSKGFVLNGIPIGIKFIINKWDKDMNLIEVGEVPMKTKDYKLGIYRPGVFKIIGNKLIHIIEYKNKKIAKMEVFITEYDKNTFAVKHTEKITSYDYKNKMESNVTVIASPGNQSEFGIMALVGNRNESKTKAEIFIFNDDLESVYEEELEFDAQIYSLRIINEIIDKNSLSFVDINSPVREKRSDDVEPDVVTFHMLGRETGDHIVMPIQLDEIERNISDFEFTFNDAGQLFISGFYEAIGEKNNDVGGAFTQLYDLSKEELIDQSTLPFGFEFLTENASDKSKKRAAKKSAKGKSFDPYQYLVRHVIANEDGSSTLVGECYRYYTTTTTDSQGRTRTTHHYVHGDLIIMRTSKDGEIEWVERMQKYIHSTGSDMGQFIFHDNEKTFEIIYGGGRSLTIAQIDKEDGSSEKEVVFTKEDLDKMALIMNNANQIGDHSYTIQARRGKKTKILKVEFDQE
jgi:hypothetical protein